MKNKKSKKESNITQESVIPEESLESLEKKLEVLSEKVKKLSKKNVFSKKLKHKVADEL